MSSLNFFITGSDTEIGKTFITCAILQGLKNQGFCAVGVKAVAAGCEADGENEDVQRIRAVNSLPLAPRLINPYCFQRPIAPHIAANEEGVNIDFAQIKNAVNSAQALAQKHNPTQHALLVEGAGGWRIPLGNQAGQDSASLALSLGLPVILVVGLRLGCLNHALISAESILQHGATLAGWIGNQIDPHFPCLADNVATLQQLMPAPSLCPAGFIPHMNSLNKASNATPTPSAATVAETAARAAEFIDFSLLIG